MAKLIDVGSAIQNNLEVLRKPGILAVRPGYHLEGGWPVGDPVIVALVSSKKGDAGAYGLPALIESVPVEVREASSLERLKATQPVVDSALTERMRGEQRNPEFPFEHSFNAAPIGVVAAAHSPSKPEIPYAPPSTPLDPVTDTVTLTCHASPDAGWPTLSAFLRRVGQSLSVGMYDFTSAHILSAVESALAGHTMSLVLDHPTLNPTADQSDEEAQQALSGDLGNRLSFAWAPVRSSPEVREWVFPTAYHIKVAVRDGQELWLSSGNWNNSNQPEDAPASDPDPARAAETFKKSDRDWHVVVAHAGLARLFETYVVNDRQAAVPTQGKFGVSPELEALAEQTVELADVNPAAAPRAPAKFFAPLTVTEPMTIQPLLTPDAGPDGAGLYATKMRELISGAQQSLYMQLQYIHPSNQDGDASFTALLDAVSARAAAGVDVRIILSQWQNSQWMERLQMAGLDTGLVRIQNGVHNKGFVVDHQRAVVSSQNWSGDGVLRNRDAGVIIDNATVARYFEQIFLHDWDNVAVARPVHLAAVAAGAAAGQICGW
jgi:hypothetical protein